MAKVTFHYDGQIREVEGKAGENILQIGLDAGVPIEHACGGNGFCTTCMCKIAQGIEHLEERTDREENMGVTDDPERLTCQATFKGTGDVTVEVADI
jgi:ferredoxin